MISAINEALLFVIEIVKRTVSNIMSTGTGGFIYNVLPFFVLGIAISVVFLAVRLIRNSTWGH